MSALLRAMDPPPPPEVLAAADDLRYRDFMTVALVVPESAGFPDNWIYIHDPGVRVGRVQNFGAVVAVHGEGRPHVPRPRVLRERGRRHVDQGRRRPRRAGQARDGVPRSREGRARSRRATSCGCPKAYPVYDEHYKTNVDVMREWIAENCPNVFPVGRNGMHKYNNQDHSMYTAMLSVENIFGADHDVWTVNVEEEYHEEGVSSPANKRGTGRDAAGHPTRHHRVRAHPLRRVHRRGLDDRRPGADPVGRGAVGR